MTQFINQSHKVNKSNSNQKRVNPRFIAFLAVALLIVTGLFFLVRNVPQDKGEKSTNDFEKSNLAIIDNSEPSPTVIDTKIYFSIADSPDSRNIDKVIVDGEVIKVSIFVENPPAIDGSCVLDILELKGVAVNTLDKFSFNISANASIVDINFSLKEGSYRTDLHCEIGEGSYSVINTINLRVENRSQIPSSYSN